MRPLNFNDPKIQQAVTALLTILSLLGLVGGIISAKGGSSQPPEDPAPAQTTTSTTQSPAPPTQPAPASDEPTTAKTPEETGETALSREQVVAQGVANRGGTIGTSGKPVIALRFDHHLDPFGKKVLPLLEKYRLPWSQIINPSTVGKSDDRWTWGQIARAAHNTGGEVWNHGWSHANFYTEEQADQAITQSLETLRDNLPSLTIDGWAPPGNTSVMGMEGADTPEKFTDTYPGQLVLSQHAFIRGYFPQRFQTLDGSNSLGQGHLTMDKRTRGRISEEIEKAVRTGTGLTLMSHPSYLDQPGYIKTSELEEALSYIAQLRDEGKLEVMSSTGIMLADKSKDEDDGDLLDLPENGAISGKTVVEVKRGLATVGVPHELEAVMTGEGQATIRVRVDSPSFPVSSEHTVSLTDTPQRLSTLVTPPKDTSHIFVSITGNANYSHLSYKPI